MINVALDYEIVLALSKWHERDFDKNGIIHELVNKFGTPYPSRVKELTQNGEMPEILKDHWLGTIVRRQSNGDRIYTNLDNIIRLYNLIVEGKVNAWILPTVSKEFKVNPISKKFAYKYCKKVFFTDNDWEKFSKERAILANSYLETGAIDKPTCTIQAEDYLPHSARKMAEASRLGMFLIVKRTDKYMHKFSDEDYLRSSMIIDCNNMYNLRFLVNNGKYLTTSPITLATFVQCQNMQKNYNNQKAYCTMEVSIDDNNMYVPDGRMDKVKNTILPERDINFTIPF